MRCGASGVCGLGMRITLAPRQRRPAKDGKGLPFTGMMTRFSPTTSWQDEAQLHSLETPLSNTEPVSYPSVRGWIREPREYGSSRTDWRPVLFGAQLSSTQIQVLGTATSTQHALRRTRDPCLACSPLHSISCSRIQVTPTVKPSRPTSTWLSGMMNHKLADGRCTMLRWINVRNRMGMFEDRKKKKEWNVLDTVKGPHAT